MSSFLENLTANTLDVPRQEGEINLVTVIAEKLTVANVSFGTTWVNDPEIASVMDQNQNVQRIAIARNLSFHFRLKAPEATIERLVLGSKAEVSEYLKLFDDYVIPGLKAIDAM